MMAGNVRLVVMRSFNHDYAKPLAESLLRLNVSAEIVEVPYLALKGLKPAHVKQIRVLLRPARGQRVIWCPGVMELFVAGPHHSLHFSAYRDWHDPAKQTVLPHPWSVHAQPNRSRLAWHGKPALSASFVGSFYANAALVRLARRLPKSVRRYLLRGRYLRHPRLVASAFAGRLPASFALAFPRSESLEALALQVSGQDDFHIELVDTRGFTGLQDAKDRYVEAMVRTTYVLCPRGSENFSFRMYEALRFGRVPVIIDTDIVLPDAVPWREVALIVPYGELNRLAARIRDDHASHDAAGFARRQRAAFEASDMLDDGRWLDKELARVVNGHD